MDLETVTKSIGWTYVLVWGVANYPTVISNTQLKSVQGISIDYLYFNLMGFVLYTLYTGSMYSSALVRREFFEETHEWPLIKLNDVIFGIHNLFTNSVIMSQAYCWGFKKNDNQRLSCMAKLVLSCVFAYLMGGGYYIYTSQGWEPVPNVFNWSRLLTSLGLVKIAMSVCKNIPQILYNYNRKSTHGWPILMIWLDFVGALLSFVQLCLDGYIVGDLSTIFDNKPKLFLAVQVFIADFIFFLQHYYLYYKRDIETFGAVNYGAIEQDERFLLEHTHDHDHLPGIMSTSTSSSCPVSNTDKDELQRLIN